LEIVASIIMLDGLSSTTSSLSSSSSLLLVPSLLALPLRGVSSNTASADVVVAGVVVVDFVDANESVWDDEPLFTLVATSSSFLSW
jgi:hypothetical protein